MDETFSSFERLIEPVAAGEFLAEYWEKQHLHLSRNRAGFFESLFALADVDRWLMSLRGGPPDSIVTTAPEGATAGARRHRPQDISVDALYDAFAQGHSLVLNYLEDSWPPLAQVVKMLGSAFCARVGVNAYITPKGSQTLAIHTDDHDVLVLQVSGEKIWRLHEMIRLSIRNLEYQRDIAFTSEWGSGRLETPLLAEIRLQPGDLLYIPRGMPHCATAKDATSLHLTISITPLYWTDFLKAAVEQASIHAPCLRRALPPGFVEGPGNDAALRRDFAAAMKSLEENVHFDEILEVVRRNRVRVQGYPADGHFAQLARLEELASTSIVERRANVLCSVEYFKDEFATIRFGSRYVRGPGRLRPVMEFICRRIRFQVSEVPGLDDQSKLVLLRRLMREGLLRFAGPAVEGQPETEEAGEVEAAGRRA